MSYFDKRLNDDLKASESKLPNHMSDPISQEQSTELDLSETEQGKMAGERGTPDVSIKKGKTNISRFFFAIGIATLIAVIIFSLFGFFAKKNDNENQPTENAQQETVIQNNHTKDFEAEQERLRLAELERLKQQSIAQAPQVNATASSTEGSPMATTSSVQEKEKEPDRRLQGNVTIDIVTSNNSSNQHNEQLPDEAEGHDTILSNRLVPSITPATVAKQRKNLTFLLRKGANIRCTLDTMIVTTHPGIARCVVNKDIYSANGKTLLIDRGSEIIGEQTTSMVQGQARVFILWTSIETPQGVSIDINSPASDNLGASGVSAQVDTHFWTRFGGALMLSMIDDIMGIASNQTGNEDYRFENTQENTRSMAEEALRNTINIPPTGYVNQGTLLNVMVARDVDFSTVYELVKLKKY